MEYVIWATKAMVALLLVPAYRLDATAYVESRWNPAVISSAGAIGPYQIKPSLAEIPRDLLLCPVHSRLEAARKLLKLKRRGGTWEYAHSAYLCGEAGLRRSPACADRYLKKIRAAVRRYRPLYRAHRP